MVKIDPHSNEMMLDYGNLTILAIPDLHIPYHHKDAFAFLETLKEIYNPDLVVNLGDLADFHNISFHNSDPDLLNAGDELLKLQSYSQELEEIFPEMIVVGSNHGDLPTRKFVANGLPRAMLRPYNDIYDVGPGWRFVDDLTIKSKTEPDLHVCHSIKKNAVQVAQQRGQRFIQGHYHTEFGIHYAGNPNSLLWGVNGGCLIDKSSLAFAYDRLNLNRPVLGATIIENGFPLCIPMVLDKNGNWEGFIR